MDMADSPAERVTVLVADDEPDMRLLVRTLLERADIEVIDEAGNGLQALAHLDALRPPPVPTVVVLDHRMPGLSGLEVARLIRAVFPDQLILLFTASSDSRVEALASEMGVPLMLKTRILDLPAAILTLAAARSADYIV